MADGHHDLSHHRNDAEKKKKIAQINRFHTTQFAYFLKRLKAVQEGAGTLLDNCMVVYGSAISEGNEHLHNNLPVLLAGRGGGTLTPGTHLKLQNETPMSNLYLSMLDRMSVPVEKIGDSTGRTDRAWLDIFLFRIRSFMISRLSIAAIVFIANGLIACTANGQEPAKLGEPPDTSKPAADFVHKHPRRSSFGLMVRQHRKGRRVRKL